MVPLCCGPVGAWYSPFPVDPAIQQRLESVGLLTLQSPHADDAGVSSASKNLVLYDTPHQLLAMGADTLTVDKIVSGYREVLSLASSRYLAMAVFRLNALSNDALRLWSSEGEALYVDDSPPPPTPLEALLARSVLEACPDLLNAYLDVEMAASLCGGSPDSNYLVRLYQCLESQPPNQLLADWHAAHSSVLARKTYLKDLEQKLEVTEQKLHHQQNLLTEKELQLSSLSEESISAQTELHRVQEELEHYFLENENSKQKLLKLNDTQNELRDCQAILDSSRKKASILAEANQNLQKELDKAQQGLLKKESLLAESFQKLEAARTTHKQQMDRIQDDLLEKNRQLEICHEAQKMATQKIASLTSSIQQLQAKLTSTEQELDEKRSELSRHNHQLQSCQAEVESQQHDLNQIQEELEHYFLENKNYRMLSEDIKQQLLRAEALLLDNDLDAPAPREHT